MMAPKLVVDGKLTVPLFHGTSTLFYDSILETGLGGRNIFEDFGLRAIAQQLLTYEEQLATLPDWLLEKRFLLKMSEDPSSQKLGGHEGFNFRYGGAYLSPSRQAAARYALFNQCGSEALAGTVKVIEALLLQLPRLAAQEQFARVLAFARRPRAPILIEARDVPEAFLRAEQGGPCGPVLEYIESVLNDREIYDTIVQQSNFELLRPIPASQLHLYKIVSPQSGYGSLEDLRLEPLSSRIGENESPFTP
jgi:hypothetical protein